MKKYNLILGIILTVVIIVASHFDYKWQTEENRKLKLEQCEYFDAQADILLKAYHDDCIEEEEFNMLYNKLEKYDANGKVYAFNTYLEIKALNEPKPYTGAE